MFTFPAYQVLKIATAWQKKKKYKRITKTLMISFHH